MKQIITIILALFFSLSTFAQTERLSLSERNRIFNSIRNLDCSVDSVLNSFRKELLKVVLFDMISENAMVSSWRDIPESYVLEVVEDENSLFEVFTVFLTRGGSFRIEQNNEIKLSNSIRRRAEQWNQLEFFEYICVNQTIPYHLIEKIKYESPIVIDEIWCKLWYTLKVNSQGDIRIVNRNLTDRCKN